MIRHFMLDENHKLIPIDDSNMIEWMKWARWFEIEENRRVAQDYVNEIHISTIFLGFDHNFFSHGPAILFETMVFNGEYDRYQERYSTWDEAVEGHKVTLEKVRQSEASLWPEEIEIESKSEAT